MKILKKSVILIALVILCLSFGACNFLNKTIGSDENLKDIKLQTVTINTISDGERQKMDIEDAVETVQRSSVAIKVASSGSTSSGSGVIVDIDCEGKGTNEFYILTCFHVISSCGSITVTLPDKDMSYTNNDYVFTGQIGGNEHAKISLVGGDKDTDIAVLKLDISGSKLNKSDICKAKIIDGTKNKVKAGQQVFAVGNPTGLLPGTVTVGHVAYLNRQETIQDVGLMTLMQIDVNTYHGSSGGGLYNLYGELIGITNAGNDEDVGINFAIPYATGLEDETGFVNIATQLISTHESFENNYGYIAGRWMMGVQTSVRYSQGVYGQYLCVVDVVFAGDFYKTGIQVNDVIKSISYNGLTYGVTSNQEFSNVVDNMHKLLGVGNTYTVLVDRNNDTLSFTVTIGQYIFCNTGNYNPAN